MSKKKTTQVDLVIGDLHCPFMHQDAVRFLAAVKAKYKPNNVIFMGDERDGHADSYHEKSPDLYSSADELDMAIKQLQPLYKMFPEATIMESNHGSLYYRKAMTAGIPEHVIKDYRTVLQAPKGWKWKYDHVLKTPMGPVYFHHGKSGSYEKLSKNMAMSAVQGHFHSKFYICYWSSPNGLYFDANAGCLVDHRSRAQAYAKNSLQKGILGCMIITGGVPQLIPMIIGKNHRWIGKL